MPAGSARLEVVAGRAAGMSIIVDSELVIGRHAEGAGRLADDEEISRSHARVSIDASGFCAIEDLGSTNGTFVNGLRITSPQTLTEGDAIELGATTLVVRELGHPLHEPAPTSPQPTIVPGAGGSAGDRPEPDVRVSSQVTPVSRPAGDGALAPPLLLEIDFDAREVRLRLGEGGEEVRLLPEAGSWRTTATGGREGSAST
jgi:pSer/pThr/pTyr-binding forkhead associated (FHA) protein